MEFNTELVVAAALQPEVSDMVEEPGAAAEVAEATAAVAAVVGLTLEPAVVEVRIQTDLTKIISVGTKMVTVLFKLHNFRSVFYAN
jgi:hypothetical protein